MRQVNHSSLCGTPLYLVENRGLISHPCPLKSAVPRICKNYFQYSAFQGWGSYFENVIELSYPVTLTNELQVKLLVKITGIL